MESVLNRARQFPGVALKWVQDRVNKIDVFDETKVDLQKTSPWYQLGGMYYLAWMVVIITGVILVALYLPTTSEAYDSIHAITTHVMFGSILRGLHKYSGDAMIIAATLKVYRMWFTAEYKNKGELTFVLGILLLVAAMYSGLTGYLLIWNQRAFWATKVFATFPTYLDGGAKEFTWFLPDIIGRTTALIGQVTHQGMSTSQILMGGSSIGQATMTRFYSLHFGISLIMLVLTELYFYKNRFKRLNLKLPAILAMLAILVTVAIVMPAESGTRSNPEVTPLPILSDWYFLALYQMLKYMDPYWATIWTLGIPFTTIGLMFLDMGPERNIWRRPIFTMIGILALIEFIIFSLLIMANQANIDRDPPYWFAHMIFFIAIGQFWHWGLYKQRLPMLFWVVFNLVSSAWYLVFWHVIYHPTQNVLYLWQHNALAGANLTNFYWNVVWLAFSVVQLIAAGILMLMDHKKRQAEILEKLEGVPA